MQLVYEFQCQASGLFALDKSIKVKQGSKCRIRRNADNLHGQKLSFIFSFSHLLIKFYKQLFLVEKIHILLSRLINSHAKLVTKRRQNLQEFLHLVFRDIIYIKYLFT